MAAASFIPTRGHFMSRKRHATAKIKRYAPRAAFLAMILAMIALLIGLPAGVAPSAMAAQTSRGGTSPSEQQALAQYEECKPLKVFHPPASFKPLTASADQLRNAGYPARPPKTHKREYSIWVRAMSRPLHFTDPNPVCTATKHSVTDSGNWAGYEVPESDYGYPIDATVSAWVQPAVSGNSNYTNYQDAPDASFWTGTGLVDIIQAGCDSIATSTPQYRCWTEDYPQGTVWEGPVVRPGQTVYVADYYEGSNVAEYYIENETTGETQSFTNPAPDVGLGSADYINERVGSDYLPAFGSVAVSSNYFSVNTGSTYDTYQPGSNANEYIMTGSTGTVMSSPSAIQSNGNFTQEFKASS
jgi:peptidase A4-like protein